MKLTRQERRRILEGAYGPLRRTDKPDVDPGAELVVSWSRPRAFADEEMKHVFAPKPERALWITVTKVVRRTKGGWSVYFDVTDARHPTWYLSKGGYTRTKHNAIDPLQADIDSKTQARLTVEARQASIDRREADLEAKAKEVRQQQRAMRENLRDTLQGLSPEAQTELMAAVYRLLEEAKIERRAA